MEITNRTVETINLLAQANQSTDSLEKIKFYLLDLKHDSMLTLLLTFALFLVGLVLYIGEYRRRLIDKTKEAEDTEKKNLKTQIIVLTFCVDLPLVLSTYTLLGLIFLPLLRRMVELNHALGLAVIIFFAVGIIALGFFHLYEWWKSFKALLKSS